MLRFLQSLFDRPARAASRERLEAKAWPAVVYAIGDVHGCAAELETLEAAIIADSAAIDGEKWIVMLGDYVDRGPKSAQVLDKLCLPPPTGFQRFALAGNHEIMMQAFLADPDPQSNWLKFGGDETLRSYGIDAEAFTHQNARARAAILQSHIPAEHLDVLARLPISMSLPGTIFVHAGLRPGTPLDKQSDDDLLWIREPFLSADTPEFGLVIHGHTPGPVPVVMPNRIAIDTGAFATGVLTAIRLSPDAPPAYLHTGNAANQPAS